MNTDGPMHPLTREIQRALRAQEPPLSAASLQALLATAATAAEPDACTALERLPGCDRAETWPAVAAIAQDASRPGRVRALAAEVLAGWPDPLRLAGALRPLLRDPDVAVRRAAAAALPLPTADLLPLLAQIEVDADAEVRAIAARKRRLPDVLAELEHRHPHDLLRSYLAAAGTWLAVDFLDLQQSAPPGDLDARLDRMLGRLRTEQREPALLSGEATVAAELEAELYVPANFPRDALHTGPSLPVLVEDFAVSFDRTAVHGRVRIPWGDGRVHGGLFRGGLAVVHLDDAPEVVLAFGRIVEDPKQPGTWLAVCHGALPSSRTFAVQSIPGDRLRVALVHPRFAGRQ